MKRESYIMSSIQSQDMTTGTIWKKIVFFALPIMWGNLFQQLYNIVDSLIVGNFVGKDALAAVSSSGSLIFLMVGLFSGIFIGAGVVISRYFGAKDYKSMQDAIHTAIAFALIFGILLTIFGLIFVPHILKLMNTPADVLPNSILYFRIYCGGIMAVVLYNTANGIFQAVGDSKHPLYYLIISSILNALLDLLFVAVFHFGIRGAGFATVISQTVSALLGFRRLMKYDTVYRVQIKKIRISLPMLKQILTMGIPSGLQNSIIAFANIVVQSNINAFGAMAVAGCGSYSRIEGFGFLPITSFSMSMTTFIGQNLGAKEYDRAKKGSIFGIVTSVTLAELIGIIIYLLAPYLISGFSKDPEVIAYGVLQARTVTLFYFLLAFSHCVSGILRGAGKSIIPMIVMLVCWCVIRISYVTAITHFLPGIQPVIRCYPITWSLSSVSFLIYYLKSDWIHAYDRIKH